MGCVLLREYYSISAIVCLVRVTLTKIKDIPAGILYNNPNPAIDTNPRSEPFSLSHFRCQRKARSESTYQYSTVGIVSIYHSCNQYIYQRRRERGKKDSSSLVPLSPNQAQHFLITFSVYDISLS